MYKQANLLRLKYYSLELVTLSGGCGLTQVDGRRWKTGEGGRRAKVKIQKRIQRLLKRRENAVQRTPPTAHFPALTMPPRMY